MRLNRVYTKRTRVVWLNGEKRRSINIVTRCVDVCRLAAMMPSTRMTSLDHISADVA